MNGVYAVGVQVDYLLGGKGYPGLFHNLGIVAVAVDYAKKALRQSGFGNRADTLYLLGVGDRHNAGYYRDIYASAEHTVHKIIENVVVEKHLGCKELTAAFGFKLQVIKVFFGIFGIGVAFGVAGAADTKAAVSGNFRSKLTGVTVVAVFKVGAGKDIPAERQYIFDTLCFK